MSVLLGFLHNMTTNCELNIEYFINPTHEAKINESSFARCGTFFFPCVPKLQGSKLLEFVMLWLSCQQTSIKYNRSMCVLFFSIKAE